jgi:hypothetical protein
MKKKIIIGSVFAILLMLSMPMISNISASSISKKQIQKKQTIPASHNIYFDKMIYFYAPIFPWIKLEYFPPRIGFVPLATDIVVCEGWDDQTRLNPRNKGIVVLFGAKGGCASEQIDGEMLYLAENVNLIGIF